MSEKGNEFWGEFESEFPVFSNFATEFYDPREDGASDVQIVRYVLNRIDPGDRTRILGALLQDADRVLASIDSIWMGFHLIVNRRFADRKAVEDWIRAVRQA